MSRRVGRAVGAGIVCALLGAAVLAEEPPGVLFSESFDDANLLQRGWYDGSKFKMVRQGAHAGPGCIEYRWQAGGTTPVSSVSYTHLRAHET